MMKSRFEAILLPIKKEEDVALALAELKKDFPKADHYPYAFRLDGRGKSSDDGEPGGTAGRPLLTLLESEQLEGAFLGVARYFGGTKLGTGNLRRCFVEAAQDCLAKASLGEEITEYVYAISLSYSDYQTVERLSYRLGFRIEESVFEEVIQANLVSDAKLNEAWEAMGFHREDLSEPKERIVLREIKR